MRPLENNYAFIDSQNLNLAIKDCGWELDFARFYIYLKDKIQSYKSISFYWLCCRERSIIYIFAKGGIYNHL